MIGRTEARTDPAKTPADAVRQLPGVTSSPRPRDPALGLVIAILGAAVIWVVVALIWAYALR